MKRKTFIKTTAAFAAVTAINPLASCKMEKAKMSEDLPLEPIRKNWAGNYTYKAEKLHVPKTAEEVQKLVKQLGAQKALESKHCFNNIADSPLNQISTENLKGVTELDEENMTVTVGAGAKYGDFAPELHDKGYALHNRLPYHTFQLLEPVPRLPMVRV
ncbi:FAD-binding protein [Maribacter litopenaei]|uniref:FAD-binding protein n=1 Tax=Maribacter litopenaei TaxID=2976127 RepID=A0ABY5Y943_9FLAO|nr:FAD-binding protein [Maribacter litopenaei]UWX55543.1 FAD-binding protein [Maribacter litopenaei]